TVCQKNVAVFSLHPGVILRCASEVEFGPADEVLGMVLHPRVAEAHVVGHEIEHEPQAALPQPLTQPGERGVASEACVDRVAGDGEAGAWNVVVAQVGERLLEFLAPFGIAARHPLGLWASLPDAEEPDPVEALVR